MNNSCKKLWLSWVVFCIVFTCSAKALAKPVIIFKKSTLDQMEKLIPIPNWGIVTLTEIRVASWETGSDDEDYLVYNPSARRCNLYRYSTFMMLPDEATLEDMLESQPYVIFEVIMKTQDGTPSGSLDSDGDGTPDSSDGCPNDPQKVEPGECGCGIPDTDLDSDGFSACNDCNDSDPNINPSVMERCNTIDDDCDGDIDEEDALGCINYYKDHDKDGYGVAEENRCLCSPDVQEEFITTEPGDCDDDDDERSPATLETCDGKDNDCDGQEDEGLLIMFYQDEDGDGYGDPNGIEYGCSISSEYADNSIDCDDTDPNINPMRSVTGESLGDLTNGRHIFMGLAPSCGAYTTYHLLWDFKILRQTVNIQYKKTYESPFQSTYWFFDKICGEDIIINQDPSDEEIFIINKRREP